MHKQIPFIFLILFKWKSPYFPQCPACLVLSGTLIKHFASLRYILFYLQYARSLLFFRIPYHFIPFHSSHCRSALRYVYAALAISERHHFGHYLVTCAKWDATETRLIRHIWITCVKITLFITDPQLRLTLFRQASLHACVASFSAQN